MNFDDSPNQILTTLYAAPLQPELWNVFLEQLSAMSGVRKAALITHHVAEKDHKILATLGDSVRDEASIQLYEHFYFEFDEWTLRFPKGGTAGKIIHGEEVLPQTSLLKSTFYNEFLKKVDICQMACLTAITAPGIFEALSIYRGSSDDIFDSKQLAILEMLAPHLRTALATRRRLLALNSRVADLENALDQLKTALVLVDGKGKPVLVNRAAHRIFDLRDGLYISSFGVAALSSAETAQLRGMIAKALVASTGNPLMHGGATLISRDNKRPLQVLVAPFISHAVAAPPGAAAIIFIADPELQPASLSDMLSQLFGLTPAEGRLALSLLEGNSLSQAAELNSVGLETVRSQLRSIFLKTGTRRQGELIGLLAGLPGQIV